MSVIVRRVAASPERTSSATWSLIADLVCKGDQEAIAEFTKVEGVASCLINDEAFSKGSFTVKNDGPRLRIYCIYGEDAIAKEDVNETPLSWSPVAGSWKAFLPCLPDDFETMAKVLGKSSYFQIYDTDKGVPDEEKSEKNTNLKQAASASVDWEAFNKL